MIIEINRVRYNKSSVINFYIDWRCVVINENDSKITRQMKVYDKAAQYMRKETRKGYDG